MKHADLISFLLQQQETEPATTTPIRTTLQVTPPIVFLRLERQTNRDVWEPLATMELNLSTLERREFRYIPLLKKEATRFLAALQWLHPMLQGLQLYSPRKPKKKVEPSTPKKPKKELPVPEPAQGILLEDLLQSQSLTEKARSLGHNHLVSVSRVVNVPKDVRKNTKQKKDGESVEENADINTTAEKVNA